MASTANLTKIEIRYVPDEAIPTVFGPAMMGSVDGFLPVDQLERKDTPGLEHSKRVATSPRNLETIYRAYQHIDGSPGERTTQLEIRSMNYGDAIVVNGTAYYVTMNGFVTVVDGEVVPVTDEG